MARKPCHTCGDYLPMQCFGGWCRYQHRPAPGNGCFSGWVPRRPIAREEVPV